MAIQSRDIHKYFSGCITIQVLSNKSAKRIISYLITRNYWFHYCYIEGYFQITFSQQVNLNLIRQRLSNIDFEIAP